MIWHLSSNCSTIYDHSQKHTQTHKLTQPANESSHSNLGPQTDQGEEERNKNLLIFLLSMSLGTYTENR